MLDIVRIADIQTTDVVYYDSYFKDKLYKFCEDRDIDILPCVGASDRYWLRNKELRDFKEQPIDHDMKIDGNLDIFNPLVFEGLQRRSIMFVYVDQEFNGVVHFSDYNKSIVGFYLYRIVNEYEKLLRNILIFKNRNNKDLIDYQISKLKNTVEDEYEKKDKIKKKKDKLRSMKRYSLFQEFDLRELIDFIEYEGIWKFNFIEANKLRNFVMHSKDFIDQHDISKDDLIYDKKSFEKFFRWVMELRKDYVGIKNRLRLLQELDQ